MRPLPATGLVDHPLHSLGALAAGFTPRLLMWAPTWWARLRRTSLRTTQETRLSLLVSYACLSLLCSATAEADKAQRP